MLGCTHCKASKPESDFHKDASRARGYSYVCKGCIKNDPSRRQRQVGATKRWKERNNDQNADYHRQYIKQHTERLSDSYVKQRLQHNSEISRSEIPPELVELKREQLTLRRLARELKKAAANKQENQ